MSTAPPDPEPGEDGTGSVPSADPTSPVDGTVDTAAAHRAALIATGAARDVEEARMFLAMLGLDRLPRD